MRSARSTVESESAAMEDAVQSSTSKMSDHFNNLSMAASAALGAGLATGISDAMEVGDATAKLKAQLGSSTADVQLATQTMQSVFRAGWGESATEVGEAIKGVALNIGDVSDAAGGLEGVTTKVMALGQSFDQDLNKVTAAAGQLLRTGLAADADAAFDIIAVGLGSSANKADDFLDTVNEYSTQFRRVGLSGAQMTGLLQQGLQGGARDADAVADAIGIFGEMALAGGDKVNEAFASIGLNGDEIGKKMRAGGTEAAGALQMTMDALRGTENETTRLAAAQVLFGDLANTQADALWVLNPATAAAGAEMKNLAGAAREVQGDMEDSPTHKMNQALREMKEVLSSALLPALNKVGEFMKEHPNAARMMIQGLIGLIGTILAVRGALAVFNTGKAVFNGFSKVVQSTAMKAIGNFLKMAAKAVASFVRIAVQAGIQGARMAAAWLARTLPAMATFMARMALVAARALWSFATMAARAVIWAATMAAQWFIALGPIGWVTAIIIGLVVLIIANWDKVKAWTMAAWNWIVAKVEAAVRGLLAGVEWLGQLPGKISRWFGQAKDWAVEKLMALVTWARGLPGRISSALSGLLGALRQRASSAFQSMKDSAVQRALSLVAWVRGLPGRISAGIGSLRSLLTEKGRNVVQGLWTGIQSMGGWIKSQLISWAKSMIPGPIAKALGIASPSKVTAEQGRWIGIGLVEGLRGTEKQVKSAVDKMRGILVKGLSGSKEKAAVKWLKSHGSDMAAMARGADKLARDLKAAQTKLDGLKKAKTDLANKVRDAILQTSNVVNLTPQEGFVDATSILRNMQAKLEQAKTFQKQLATLRKKGLSNTLIKQIAEAGPEAGAATAAALTQASSAQIKALNSTQSEMAKTASNTAKSVSSSMYDAGIRAAQGMVRGIASQKKKFDAFIKSWAEYISYRMKKYLGIKSPSRVMADQVGKWLPLGVIEGIDKMQPKLTARTEAMVQVPDVPSVNAVQPPTPAPMATGQVPYTVNIDVGGQRLAELLIDPLRKTVRNKGGNVQVVLGGA